ncbi:ATP-dependent nuclease [Pseudooceanicola aestuarii]|uniref:ATP-dependent nuclease n=1 Tax=Pseudooceanicola aestuarii TaxID=2697319 RepID=UPI0013D0CFA5|nr:ATP-binding protein [Pseudooceanicola aestuarii]
MSGNTTSEIDQIDEVANVHGDVGEKSGSGSGAMKLTKATIKNFKAIEETTVPLSDFTVIVGTNGSGKSSILQALHWMLQSGRNLSVEPRSPATATKNAEASTLSELEATYMPSPEYKNASHSTEYGNFAAAPRMDLEIEASIDGAPTIGSSMWIKSARNEGISVHIPSNNLITTLIRSQQREISAYIPGLAGIPLSEEKRSKRIVHRQAAAGDANTVLRNILELLKATASTHGADGLAEVEELVSRVLGPLNLQVTFDDEKDYKINAAFQTEAMKVADPKRFKPLELAGIGFLQVIQIFAYLVYFRPRLLLVDEPDSHLHPDAQERLTLALMDAAIKYDCQVLLTTHSPSVVRALTVDATLIWMKQGKVASDNTDEIRRDMGWGLLDKSILLVTEDDKVGMLNKLLSQWPTLFQKTAIWPARGSSSLPPAASIAGLRQLFGNKMKIVLHRDCDFMLQKEQALLAQPYSDQDIAVWFTNGSDIESYWINDAVVSFEFAVSAEEARELINDACDLLDAEDAAKRFNCKRTEVLKQIPAYRKGEAEYVGTAEARDKLSERGREFTYVGKELLSAVRRSATDKGQKGGHGLGKALPGDPEVAEDLKMLLQGL